MSDPIRSGGRHPFVYQKPDRDQVDRIEQVRTNCGLLYDIICSVCPPSRERSLAITNLEQVSMWANKAIVMEEPKEQAGD